MPVRPAFLSLLAAVLLTGSCAYEGEDIGNPFRRKVQWFSFVAGEDLAESCAAGSPERFRLVYNALWEQQVRIYEWESAGPLRVRVLRRGGNLIHLSPDDLLAPWRTEDFTADLNESARAGLDSALERSGAFGTPAAGLELPSHSYYWTSASCRRGKYVFTAWAHPSPAFDTAQFPPALAALDPDRETIIPASAVPLDPFREYDRKRGAIHDFTLKVGTEGLSP